MANSGSFTTNTYGSLNRGLKFEWSISSSNASANTVTIKWTLKGTGSTSNNWYWSRGFSVTIDGTKVFSSNTETKLYSGTLVGSGTTTIKNASGKKFTASAKGAIYSYSVNVSGSGSWTLPTLAVSPTRPTSISATGGAGGRWVNVSDPKFNASWSGATRGTYTISGYTVEVAKYGTNTWSNTGTVSTSATSGSVTNRKISGISIKGGDQVQLRIGMKTTDGQSWGYTVWGSTFKVYSVPVAPTTLSVPSSVEIDSGFNVTWSGAKAGSNGLSGYDLQVRAHNGSSWTDWVNVLTKKNQTSYSVASIKNLTVSGVSYSTNGENVKFQYRVRAYDGQIGYSSWKTSGEVKILINAPTTPRKFNYKWNK